ncbi:MAG: SNF2-related protein [Candidatus Eisenbacteria bacterium]|nr:SNF2-related protein [Candidatus Eisenbacteria bacterium]
MSSKWRKEIRVGEKVFHRTFGEGLVVDVKREKRYDILEVVFSDGVRKLSSEHPLTVSEFPGTPFPLVWGSDGKEARRRRSSLAKGRISQDHAGGISIGDGMLTLDPTSLDVIAQLSSQWYESYQSFLLRRYAELIRLGRGNERLVSLGSLRDVNRYKHQLAACLKVIRELRGRALLADEVGLGKTVEAGIVLKEYLVRSLVGRALILVPVSLCNQWQEELTNKFGLDSKLARLPGDWKNGEIVVASMDTAKSARNRDEIRRCGFDIVIVDEAHRMRNHKTLAWRFVNSLSPKYLLLLTATPVQNDLRELYNLITLLRPGTLGTFRTFKQQFMMRGDKRKPKNTGRLSRILSTVMLRTTRGNTAIKFAKRHVETVEFALSQQERELYDSVSEFVSRQTREGRGSSVSKWYLTLLVLQKEIGSSSYAAARTLSKMKEKYRGEMSDMLNKLLSMAENVTDSSKLNGLLRTLRAVDEKVIVFTQFKTTLDFLVRNLAKEGIETVSYHGGLSLRQKEIAVKQFRDSVNVFLSTEAGGEGRNLQFCRTIVNYDLPWNPMRIEQRIGRVHRLGQERDVRIFNFSAADTVEWYVLETLYKKINMFELVVGEMEMILGNLDERTSFDDLIFKIWTGSKKKQEFLRKLSFLGEKLLSARKQYEKAKELDVLLFDTPQANSQEDR